MALASGEGELPAAGPSLQTLLSLTAGGLHVLPVLISVVGLAYFAGAVKLWRSGRRWSVWATTSFMAGCALVLAVTVSGVEVYGSRIFSIFMFQQLTLMMAAPVLLVLGRPGTLLLKALPRRGRAAVLGRPVLAAALWGLRSRLGRVLLHPVVCLPLFLACFYGMYLTDLAGVLLSSPAGHTAAEVAFLAAGVLFTVPVLSNDPLPAVHAPMTQAAEVLLEAFLHAFFGVIIMMASTPLVPHFADPPPGWGVDVMADQAVAGGLAWSYGEIPSVLLLVVIFVRWRRSDEAAASARDRYVEEHGDAELEAYNAHLAALAAGSPARHDADGRTTPDPSSRSGSETGSETGSATGPGTGS
ncbi:cytochrome c oxidase assembly protein [Quadrisphaera setariae]|uniref:Cytochrome c oxidase assembly protein n=1 Tax=Quadrisphaera setariae TaxID=2593304 RepID=A0A5C8Z5U2_9ACTN|nr:cytochrome c oxidase assembly protein [Quadrisphaera setariae]TNM60443.1 cytochrome c oxidase assembly protein [Streptomyces sp. NP160]TXR52501.1 cytochrome c oxidase assembly protein [Quadrisphaera setariae]